MPASFLKVPATHEEVSIMPPRSENCPDPESLTPSAPQVIYVQATRQQPMLWLIAGLLAVIAVALIFRGGSPSTTSLALAEPPVPSRAGIEGGRGIYAFTGQLSSRSYGLFMMDTDSGTVWCYEIQSPGANGANSQPRLKLLAARSWIFDRYLEEFNTGEPIPSEVREMVQAQREQRLSRPPTTRPAARAGSDNTSSATIGH